MMNINAICPDCTTFVEVRDDWYPSYEVRNRLYVVADVYVRHSEEPEYKYVVVLSFWGNDDYGVEKCVYVNTEDEAITAYRWLKKFLNKIKKMYTMNLDMYLYRNGFKPV